MIFTIDIYQSKQCKTPTSSINEGNREIFSLIGAVVIDTHQRTHTEKTLSFIKYREEAIIEKNYQTTFFQFVFVDVHQ